MGVVITLRSALPGHTAAADSQGALLLDHLQGLEGGGIRFRDYSAGVALDLGQVFTQVRRLCL